MTSIGRYTLIVEEQENKNLIPFGISNNKTPNIVKVDLATIDRYTTKFSTPNQLIEDLKNRQIVVKDYRKIYIGYRYNQEEQKLEVAFSEHEQLGEIAKKSDSKVNINSLSFNRFLNHLLGLLDNNNFYHFLLEQKNNDIYVISDKSRLKDYLDQRYSIGSNDEFTLSKIKEHMASYKKFRDIYFVVYEYDRKIDRLFYFLDDPMFCQEILASINISPKIKSYIRECLNGLSEYSKHKIKEESLYSDLKELDRIVNIFEEREKVEDERILRDQISFESETLDEEILKEEYPEAYFEHRINPYSSYEEEQKYNQYMDELMEEELKRSKEEEQAPKVKVLRRKKVDPRQLSLFDKEEN